MTHGGESLSDLLLDHGGDVGGDRRTLRGSSWSFARRASGPGRRAFGGELDDVLVESRFMSCSQGIKVGGSALAATAKFGGDGAFEAIDEPCNDEQEVDTLFRSLRVGSQPFLGWTDLLDELGHRSSLLSSLKKPHVFSHLEGGIRS